MDHYYARFLEFESNFRPARVFHSACAVTSYYAYLKQRMKALFQISSLWATPYTPSYTVQYKQTTEEHTVESLSGNFPHRHFSKPISDLMSKISFRQYGIRECRDKRNMSNISALNRESLCRQGYLIYEISVYLVTLLASLLRFWNYLRSNTLYKNTHNFFFCHCLTLN